MRRATIGLLGLAMLAAFPLAAHADEAEARDDRWLPWIGCWEGAPEPGDAEADGLIVCFGFLGDSEGAELLTYQDGELVSREEIRADGAPAPIEDGGCVGERFAQWSADGRRLFLTSEMRCGEGVIRTTRGVMSVLPDGRSWVEIHGVDAGGEAPFVGLRTFVPASAATLAEFAIQPPEGDIGLAVATSRSQAAQALTVDDLVEVVEIAGPSVASALLVERRERFALDARTARTLAERGVPGEVLDVIVALDHPERFEIEGDARHLRAEVREPEARQPAQRATAPWPLTGPRYGYGSSWGLYGRFGYRSSLYDPFFFDPFFHDPFFSRRFGSGFFHSPRVIFVGSPQVRDRTVVDPQRGYSSDQDTGRRAVPSTTRTSSPSPARTPGATRTPTPSSGSSGATRASPRGGYSSGGSGERQARPRNDPND